MRRFNRLAVTAITLAFAAPVTAQEAMPAGEVSAAAPAPFSEAVDADALRSIAGREDVGAMVAQADQRNVVSNNSVVGNSVTGTVSIDGNAFQNLQGLAVISANSGNNVAMNAAMNVTINMAPR